MTRDELEFAISQYLDGNLAAAEESALEARLASDADARALLTEYRSLDRVLRSSPIPDIDSVALADRIRGAVAGQDEPAQSYRLHWVRTAAVLALAACVVIAVSLGIRRLQAPPAPTGPIAKAPAQEPKRIVVIDTTPRTAPSAAPVAVVSVGPSAAAADRPALARYHEDLLSRPSQVIIARNGSPSQDGALLP
jgi:negative regulator of sigma E activity